MDISNWCSRMSSLLNCWWLFCSTRYYWGPCGSLWRAFMIDHIVFHTRRANLHVFLIVSWQANLMWRLCRCKHGPLVWTTRASLKWACSSLLIDVWGRVSAPCIVILRHAEKAGQLSRGGKISHKLAEQELDMWWEFYACHVKLMAEKYWRPMKGAIVYVNCNKAKHQMAKLCSSFEVTLYYAMKVPLLSTPVSICPSGSLLMQY